MGLLDSCSHLCQVSTNPTGMPSLCFTKKLQDSWWAVIILQTMENNVDRQLYSISIIYSCLDSPAKSQTAFCQLLCTHSGKIASVLRSLEARHTKIAWEEEAHAGVTCLYLQSKTKNTISQSVLWLPGYHLKYKLLPLYTYYFFLNMPYLNNPLNKKT